jgi:3-oxoacyl-[acyl-carrier protein] reductase
MNTPSAPADRRVGRRHAARHDGLSVVVTCTGNRERADAVVQEIQNAGGQAMTVAGDLADEAQVTMLFDVTEQAFGVADVLVHAAGIMLLAPLADLDDFDAMHLANLRSTFAIDGQVLYVNRGAI